MDSRILALLWGQMNGRLNRFYLLFPLGFFFLSCHKDNRQELFLIHHQVDFTIQPGLNTLDTHIYDVFPIKSMLDEELAAHHRTLDEIVSIEPKRAYLSSVFGDVNLDFIDRVSALIFDPYNQSDRIEFCYLDQIPFKKKYEIELFPGIADVSDWIEREYFGVEVRLNYREISPSLIQMRLEFDLRVLGQ